MTNPVYGGTQNRQRELNNKPQFNWGNATIIGEGGPKIRQPAALWQQLKRIGTGIGAVVVAATAVKIIYLVWFVL